MVSNNNSQGSESPLPSPRFSRYIRTPASSDNTDSNSRPSSATSTNYSPRVGKICSQPPNASLGKTSLKLSKNLQSELEIRYLPHLKMHQCKTFKFWRH